MTNRIMVEALMEKYRNKAREFCGQWNCPEAPTEFVEALARQLTEADLDGQQKAAFQIAVVAYDAITKEKN